MLDYIHQPVLLKEVLRHLSPKPGGCYCDGTIGGGGHAAALLEASAPSGRLFGCDRDVDAVQAAHHRLVPYAGRFEIRQCCYADLATWVPSGGCDGAVIDLGVSSPQLDQARRGFSFQQDGPLDMRMDAGHGFTASELLNTASTEELTRVFREYGEEPGASGLARAVVLARQISPWESTRQLADFVLSRHHGRRGRVHPATRVFQALRIAVNDELAELERGLPTLWGLLRPGGRLAVISFHSLEARIVKAFGRRLARDYQVQGEVDRPEFRVPATPSLRWVTRKAVRAEENEQADNPRSRSAELRVFERL